MMSAEEEGAPEGEHCEVAVGEKGSERLRALEGCISPQGRRIRENGAARSTGGGDVGSRERSPFFHRKESSFCRGWDSAGVPG